MIETKPKSTRGRTKGSYSFIVLPLKDVVKQLTGVDIASPIQATFSVKWVEAVGIQTSAIAKNSLETAKQTTVATAEGEPIAPLSPEIEL
jgi:hypothetical protein